MVKINLKKMFVGLNKTRQFVVGFFSCFFFFSAAISNKKYNQVFFLDSSANAHFRILYLTAHSLYKLLSSHQNCSFSIKGQSCIKKLKSKTKPDGTKRYRQHSDPHKSVCLHPAARNFLPYCHLTAWHLSPRSLAEDPT